MVNSVESLLTDRNIAYTHSGKDVLIKCLNPDHVDNTPSLRIDKLSGVGHCFSCGFSVNLFTYFNENSPYQQIAITKLKEKINRIWSKSYGIPMPKKAIPFIRDYRNISGETYKLFNAFTLKSPSEFSERVIFPMKDIRGKIIAFNARHFDNNVKPKYYIYPSNIELPLFPEKLEVINGKLVLVEGIFDFLNLYDKGLKNAAAILGVSTLHSKKRGLNKDKINSIKIQGVQKIYLMLDGDAPGRKAAEQLKPLLEEENFLVEIIDLPDDTDPGELSRQDVEKVISYIR